MSGARKLQTEIERVMKKVDEGVELFDEIWEKVYSAEQQNQKEKYEMDLKKEIKKLQRQRDQIKTWIGSSDVKDKDSLIDARKLIETKMEQFKICEKETKTKTYSKEGLAREERLDPVEKAKRECAKWLGDYIEKLNQLVEDRDVEIERLSAGKGKKTNKHIIEEYNQYVVNHKFHINKLEGIMRLVNNDRLDVKTVGLIREDLDYYIEFYEDEDYKLAYDEEYLYDPLGLDDLDVVNVDRVTQASKEKTKSSTEELADTVVTTTTKTKKEKKSKTTSVIPLKIGRAMSSTSGKEEREKTPSKAGRQASTGTTSSQPSLGPVPTTRAPPPPGKSMASILKRESEQQEKERQQKLQQQQQARQAELQRQQQIQRQQQEQLRQQEALRQQQQQAQQKAAQQEALRQQQLKEQQLQQQQKEAAAKQQQLQAQTAAEQSAAQQQQQQQQQRQQEQQQQQQQQQQQRQQEQQQQQQQQQVQQQKQQQRANLQQAPSEGVDLAKYGLNSLTLMGLDGRTEGNSPVPPSAKGGQQGTKGTSFDSSYMTALNESLAHMPTSADSDRQRQYAPNNPYPTPASYPSTQSPIFGNPAIFEKLGTDALFFIFYYQQGTYQQYLAARELKKQSWRYHKQYMTWFQRHEEPKVTAEDYEQGTYVYFDYESGWCSRIKTDFRFEYSFLEDSLQ